MDAESFKRVIKQLKKHESLFSPDEHDFINACTMKLVKKVPLSPNDCFNLGILYSVVDNHTQDARSIT